MNTQGNRRRVRRLVATLLLTLTTLVAGCTPEEIELSVERIATSFEQGGIERGLFDSVAVLNHAIPVVEMRFRAAFGP